MRLGEKLYEELLIGDDPTPTGHPRIMKAHEALPLARARRPATGALAQGAHANDLNAIKAVLRAMRAWLATGETGVSVTAEGHRRVQRKLPVWPSE